MINIILIKYQESEHTQVHESVPSYVFGPLVHTHVDICFKFQINVCIMVQANDNESLLVFLCIAKICK